MPVCTTINATTPVAPGRVPHLFLQGRERGQLAVQRALHGDLHLVGGGGRLAARGASQLAQRLIYAGRGEPVVATGVQGPSQAADSSKGRADSV